MSTINITGTITNASGTGVENVPVRLIPKAPTEAGAEAIDGSGIILDPVEVLTASDGTFTIPAVTKFRYSLLIEAIGFNRDFVCPSSNARFDLLGLVPKMEQAKNYVDEASGDTYVELTVKVVDEATVRERYNEVVLYRSITGIAGSYTELDALILQVDTNSYEFTDVTGDSAYYYSSAYRQTVGPELSQQSDPILGSSDPQDLLLTIDELADIYLFGATLTNDDGNPFPDRMFRHYIEAATDWLAKELDIQLIATDISEELHDHFAKDYGRWGYFQLHEYPIIGIDEVKFQYPSMTDEVIISDDWIVLCDGGVSGVIQVVPGQGNIADVLLIPGMLMPLWSGATGRVPGIWKISYRAGFEPGECPADLKHAIAMQAAIGVFNIAGDLIAGAGIANKSISVPGLSQNVGTTSSATNSGYGARIIEYQKELKEMLPNLRRFYGKGTRMVVV
tara:strand:- start:496 stop:1845 length:1350 start_codon:yes stop_codon:yes gene_type:complete